MCRTRSLDREPCWRSPCWESALKVATRREVAGVEEPGKRAVAARLDVEGADSIPHGCGEGLLELFFFLAMILKFGFGAQSKGPTGVAPNRDELHYRVWIRGYASNQSDQKAFENSKRFFE